MVEILNNLFNKIYNDAHLFVQTRLPVKMAILEAMYIRQCIDLLDGLLYNNKDVASMYFFFIHAIYARKKKKNFDINL